LHTTKNTASGACTLPLESSMGLAYVLQLYITEKLQNCKKKHATIEVREKMNTFGFLVMCVILY